MKRSVWLGAVAGLVLLVFNPPAYGAEERLRVFTSILPQQYFVEKVGGERVQVDVMVRPGANPELYEPRPNQMAALAGARIYFAIGVPFEAVWLAKFRSINPDMLVVHTDEGIGKRAMEAHHHGDANPQEGGNESAGTPDPHVWLSPPLVMLQARNVLMGLIRVDPDHRLFYEANYNRFLTELAGLDGDLLNIFADKGANAAFLVFHPAWGYFARAYHLEQIPVELEGKEPKPGELSGLIEYARKRGIKVVFVQPQFSTRAAEVVAGAIGAKVLTVDPLAPDWEDNLRRVGASFRAALR